LHGGGVGGVRLEPACAGDNERPFYKATTSLNTLALMDPLIEGEGTGRRFEFFAVVEPMGLLWTL